MSGKDLVDSVKVSSNRICKVLGGEPPEGFHFELFMDEHNQKISKSKGNGLTMEDWLRYGAPESLAYYMFRLAEVGQAALFRRHPQGDGRISAAPGRLQPGPRGRRQAPPTRSTTRCGASTAAAAGQGLAGVVQPAAEPGLGGQRLGQGDPVGFHVALHAGRDARRASRCWTAWPATTRSTTTRTSSCRPSASARPTRRSAPPWRTSRAAEGAAGRLQGRRQRSRTRSTAGKAAGFEPLRTWFRRSTKCCWARPKARASARSRRSSAWPKRSR
jgi:hypothetical protein